MSRARVLSDALLKTWCQPLDGDVLSLGSGSDLDGTGRAYRSYFPKATSYTTSEVSDIGCDLVLDVRDMDSVPDASYDVIFCSGVLEHVDDCHAGVRECWRILRPNGVFLVGLPFQQKIHRAPQDFWRFTRYGVEFLLRAFVIEALEPIGDDVKFPWTYWARARKAVA